MKEKRKEYYQSFTANKFLPMSEEGFLEYISKLWSMLIWGNKKYVVDKLISKLAKPETPVLQVYNKADLIYPEELPHGEGIVPISAKKGMNMEGLLQAIEKALAKARHHVIAVLPYSVGGMVETLHKNAQVKNVEYTADGIEVETVVDDILYGRLRDYIAMEL